MKLRVMQEAGRKCAPMRLCDESGAPLPGQQKVTVEHFVGDVTRVTVVLLLDGENVRLG